LTLSRTIKEIDRLKYNDLREIQLNLVNSKEYFKRIVEDLPAGKNYTPCIYKDFVNAWRLDSMMHLVFRKAILN
jgi:hypothetical protein